MQRPREGASASSRPESLEPEPASPRWPFIWGSEAMFIWRIWKDVHRCEFVITRVDLATGEGEVMGSIPGSRCSASDVLAAVIDPELDGARPGDVVVMPSGEAMVLMRQRGRA